MKQPFWKRLASHFIEIPLEHLSSEINENLHVTLNRGRYQLSTDTAIYSYADLYDNFTKTFKNLSFDRLPNQEVLILGFGLGSIPQMLEQKFHQQFHYTGIEKDEAVIHLANKYVLPSLHSRIEILLADAFLFVEQCTQQFGLICMDVFLDSIVPEHFETEQFLFRLKELLSPNGLLLFNKLANDTDSTNQTRYFYEYTFRNVFPNAIYMDVTGNWMLVSDRDKLIR